MDLGAAPTVPGLRRDRGRGAAGCDADAAGRPRPPASKCRAACVCGTDPPLPTVWALTRYTDPVRSAILAGKERGRRDLPALLGVALGRAVVRLLRLALLPEPSLAGACAQPAIGGSSAEEATR